MYVYTHTHHMWVDRHVGVSHALDTSSRSLLCGRVASRIFLSFLSSEGYRPTIDSSVKYKFGGVAWQGFLSSSAAGIQY